MKNQTTFVCRECGYISPKWIGKCTECGTWNSMDEQYAAQKKSTKQGVARCVQKLSLIKCESETRYKTGMEELDRVLGGGLVKGSLVLVGGDPGIGKSTLLLQVCDYLGKNNKILYVSGEESQNQIKMRADRLKINGENLLFLAETDVDNVRETILAEKPGIVIIDSVQTMYKQDITSAPGSVSQVREATLQFMNIAKENEISVFVVGHVTKEGAIAGPRVLEHMVDCVLYFEGERSHAYRILRAVKNRFGSTNEIGVFEMNDSGLCEVENPSMLFLSGRPNDVPGSVVVCNMEGTRPILSEIQGLTASTGFGMPRRTATGVDYNRAVMLLAVLEKKAGLNLGGYDAYINVVGGVKITETAADLGIILAVCSSLKNKMIEKDVVAVGEVGLTGEIRSVNFVERRINEAAKMGFKKILVPAGNMDKSKKFSGIDVVYVKDVTEAIKEVIN